MAAQLAEKAAESQRLQAALDEAGPLQEKLEQQLASAQQLVCLLALSLFCHVCACVGMSTCVEFVLSCVYLRCMSSSVEFVSSCIASEFAGMPDYIYVFNWHA